MRLLAFVCVIITVIAELECKKINPFQVLKHGPPTPLRSRHADPKSIKKLQIDQPLDHFNSSETRTYKMRYITNDQYFKEGGPVLIMLGGEWTISPGFLLGGHMHEIGKDINAFLVYTEHRYYGESKPFNDTSTENLKYLVVDQALADVVYLVKELKMDEKFAKSKVIVFGGSYSGNMATWIRFKYPHIIDGAVSSSGPVLAKADFFEYLETVNDAILSEGNQECLETIREAVKETKRKLFADQSDYISEIYSICEPIETKYDLDVQTFFSLITDFFSGLVQYASDDDINATCSWILERSGTPMEKLAAYISLPTNYNGDCYEVRYEDLVEYFGDIEYWDPDVYTSRLWVYQTCTEYGYYQTTTSKNQPFGDNLHLYFYMDNLCKDLYGESFTSKFVEDSVARTNAKYDGLMPNVTNVISIHGSIDPWHRLGITKDLNDKAPAILIKGTSHCVDLLNARDNDLPELTAARLRIRSAVMSWILE